MAGKKGVVLETEPDGAIILMDNGTYRKIKTSAYLEVGQIYQEKNHTQLKYVTAAILLLAIIFSTIDYFSVQAYAQVASTELGINRWGRVVSARAMDNQGQLALKHVDVKNQKIEDAAQKLYEEALGNQPIAEQPASAPRVELKGIENTELKQDLLQKINQGLTRAIQNKRSQVTADINKIAEPLSTKANSDVTGARQTIDDIHNANKEKIQAVTAVKREELKKAVQERHMEMEKQQEQINKNLPVIPEINLPEREKIKNKIDTKINNRIDNNKIEIKIDNSLENKIDNRIENINNKIDNHINNKIENQIDNKILPTTPPLDPDKVNRIEKLDKDELDKINQSIKKEVNKAQ